MRHLLRLLLFLSLLVGLAAAPAVSFAAPQGHEQMTMAMMAGMDATMPAHHRMVMQDVKAPGSAPAHDRHHAAACAAWCAGAFLTTLPVPTAWPSTPPSLHLQPALAERLAGLAPAPPLQPPKSTLS
jgi:hypothetical protein